MPWGPKLDAEAKQFVGWDGLVELRGLQAYDVYSWDDDFLRCD